MSSRIKYQQASPMELQGKQSPIYAIVPDNFDGLALSCQDDDWLRAFIQDMEQNHLMTAPTRIQAETLEKAQKRLRSRRIQLMIYSMRVSLAAAGAIVILFTMPFFLEQSWSKNTPPSQGYFTFGPPFSGKLNPFLPLEESPQKSIGIRSISESLSDLSNELFGR